LSSYVPSLVIAANCQDDRMIDATTRLLSILRCVPFVLCLLEGIILNVVCRSLVLLCVLVNWVACECRCCCAAHAVTSLCNYTCHHFAVHLGYSLHMSVSRCTFLDIIACICMSICVCLCLCQCLCVSVCVCGRAYDSM
jgi:hypothetical protein